MEYLFRLSKNLIKIVVLSTFILLSGCQEDDSMGNEMQNEDPANSTGRFSNHLTCTIISTPGDLNLNSFYTKYLNCSGIPILGSPDVPDEAMFRADETLEFMLTGRGNIRNQLIEGGNYAVLVAEGLTVGNMPGFQQSGGESGRYQSNLPALASGVASLLCNPDVGYGHTLVHEFAHMMHLSAIVNLNSNFDSELSSAYSNALSNGLWKNTYAISHRFEYLAEAVTSWYGVNWIGPEGGDGSRNNIGTRGQLQQYDPTMYDLLNQNFNSLTNMPGCRIPVIWQATANCPSTVTDIDGNIYEVVNIGSMCWMKENLKTTRYRDGTPIPNLTENSDWSTTNSGAWANYNNIPAKDAIFGKLYNWYALNNSAGLCPTGWHVPNFQELQALANFAGGDHSGNAIKSTNLWDPFNPNHTNSSGFTALPSGERHESGNFQGEFNELFLGSITNGNSSNETYYAKSLFNDQDFVFTAEPSKNFGTSCRCVED